MQNVDMDADPFALPLELEHPEFKVCSDCGKRLVWEIWTSSAGNRCKGWRCPSKTYGHTTTFV